MRGGVAAAVFLALLVAVPQAGAGSLGSSARGSMTVAASPRTAGAHRVRLTLTLRYRMQCGYPGEGRLAVTFPSAFRLPKRFVAGSVRLAGKSIAAKVHGRKVTVTIPAPDGALCGVIGPGSVVLRFTHAAKIVNPSQAGSYRFTASHGRRTFTARLAIEPTA
jgi:hypothetical protein